MKQEEELNKSIDAMIDSFFAEPVVQEEVVEKAAPVMDELIGAPKQSSQMKSGSDAGPAETQADQVKAAKPKKEKDGENGRPKQVSDVPDSDEDGSRAKGYEAIQEKNEKTPETSPKGTMVKAFEVSAEDFEFLQKAKKDAEDKVKEETLKKARDEQATLIKSAVVEATKSIKDENASLKKSLEETQALIKAMAKKPVQAKAVTSIQAMEKSFQNGEPVKEEKSFSKSDMLDVAEELVKSKQLTVEHCIELEDTGYIFDPAARSALEKAMRKRS